MGFNIHETKIVDSNSILNASSLSEIEGKNYKVKNIKFEDLVVHENNFYLYEERDIIALAELIRKDGLLEPLTVKKHDEKYDILGGQRRYRAIEYIRTTDETFYQTVPCNIVDITQDEELELIITSNFQRVKTDYEKVEECRLLRAIYKDRKANEVLTQNDFIASKMNASVGTIKKYLGIYDKLDKSIYDNQFKKGLIKYSIIDKIATLSINEQLEFVKTYSEDDSEANLSFNTSTSEVPPTAINNDNAYINDTTDSNNSSSNNEIFISDVYIPGPANKVHDIQDINILEVKEHIEDTELIESNNTSKVSNSISDYNNISKTNEDTYQETYKDMGAYEDDKDDNNTLVGDNSYNNQSEEIKEITPPKEMTNKAIDEVIKKAKGIKVLKFIKFSLEELEQFVDTSLSEEDIKKEVFNLIEVGFSNVQSEGY